jgi:hypothetical protein
VREKTHQIAAFMKHRLYRRSSVRRPHNIRPVISYPPPSSVTTSVSSTSRHVHETRYQSADCVYEEKSEEEEKIQEISSNDQNQESTSSTQEKQKESS